MGLRGPAPKPTALRVIEGSAWRANVNEPKPGPAPATCPRKLSPQGKAEWKRLMPVLRRMRVLTEADLGPLADLCEVTAELDHAQKLLRESNLLTRASAKGSPIRRNPLVSIIKDFREQKLRLEREFGLTPASRTRLMVDEERTYALTANDLERALCG